MLSFLQTQYLLSIPKPCDQRWEEMEVTPGGKYCVNCSKTVTDFTNFSNQELASFFKKNKEDVCGRFNRSQLDKEYSVSRNRIPFFYPTSVALVTTFLMLTDPATGRSFSNLPSTTVRAIVGDPLPGGYTNAPTDTFRIIRGFIKHADTEKPLERAYVRVEHTNIVAFTDSSGFYELFIPMKYAVGAVILVNYYNYPTILIPLGSLTTVNISLREEITTVGGVRYIRKKKKLRLWRRK
jgi:hypothetical protein